MLQKVNEGGEQLRACAKPKTPAASIAILGSNPVTVNAAPFGDPSWLIYTCSPDNTPYGHGQNCRELPRFDQTFEVHLPLEHPSRPYAYLEHISKRDIVWLRDKKALASGKFPGGRLYPEKELKGTSEFHKLQIEDGKGGVNEIVKEVPRSDGLFCPYQFTSTIAYMLAKAIVDIEEMRSGGKIPAGVQSSIGIWGVLQQTDNEYAYQRPGIQYFLWEAKKRGIKVIANRESCLFDMPEWNW